MHSHSVQLLSTHRKRNVKSKNFTKTKKIMTHIAKGCILETKRGLLSIKQSNKYQLINQITNSDD